MRFTVYWSANFVGRCRNESKDNTRLHRMQAKKLRNKKEQEE